VTLSHLLSLHTKSMNKIEKLKNNGLDRGQRGKEEKGLVTKGKVKKKSKRDALSSFLMVFLVLFYVCLGVPFNVLLLSLSPCTKEELLHF